MLYSFSKDVTINNKDTFIHEILHDLLNEVFRDPKFELVWANSESLASKSRRNSNKENENLKGKKPDFKLVMNVVDEILFGEVKPPKSKNSTLLLNKDLVKLANFQAGSLEKVWQQNRAGFFWNMDLWRAHLHLRYGFKLRWDL
ncbi:unnamed protein product [Rhizophagus irregularis]|nr:unnamed protein product [Rhizophagus irregularis]